MNKKIYETLIKCIEFIANNKLIVKIQLRNRLYHSSLLTEVKYANGYLTFERINEDIAYFNEYIHSIKFHKQLHYLKNNLYFDDKELLLSDINEAFLELSKNKQKELTKIIAQLESNFTITKIQKFILFLQSHFNFYFSSVYGFDGCSFIILEVYNYDSEGMKKAEFQKSYNNNKKEIVKLEKIIEKLKEENKGLKTKIKQNQGKIF